jgi:transposase
MAFSLVPDEFWHEIEPLLPAAVPKPKGGRPRIPDRAALTGIVYVLRSGAAWKMLPQELGCGSGVSCWRRLRDWTKLGIWPEVHRRLLNVLGRRGDIDLNRAIIDSQSVRAVFGGAHRSESHGQREKWLQTPLDRGGEGPATGCSDYSGKRK